VSDHVEFGTLTPEGVTNVHYISRAALLACPRVMLVPEHYRDDGTCRCDVATVCEDCQGQGEVPGLVEPDLLFPCRSCDGVGLHGWSE